MTLGTMNHDTDKDDLIQLEPLIHQVSGHSSMFVLDDVTVCKPLIGREYRFYRTLPPEMKKYTPDFRGSLQVLLQEVGEGLSLAALPNEQMSSIRSNLGTLKPGRRCVRRVSSSSIEYESEGEEETASGAKGGEALSTTHPDTHNPWLEQCHQTTLNKLKQKSQPSNVVECIMLENLTFKYRYPCVLDLKMGTRQYGDDAPESKRKSQTAKAANTTTITLGVRLAGMQVYNKEEKCYHCKNKYFGQQLTEEDFKKTLWQFLHNGRRLRIDIADLIIQKLEELRSIISKLDSVRFFTSSLLILYDGYDPCSTKLTRRDRECERDRDSRTTDTSSRGRAWPESRAGDDRHTQRDKWPSKEPSPGRGPKHPTYIHETTTGGGKMLREQVSRGETDATHRGKGRYRNRCSKSPIDIRLIDFAHATHKGMGDSKIYSGPDEGIMLGLESLTKIFTDIRDTVDH
ncbi:hypothetical protein Pcinc_004151 [Petrolisthes cinctipes]|uniref:Kinase n=1 Tax=Petrolisthes cinctipes TaxID=88211 RepID=A0AAE1EIN9_PETCI|nr:hypothetical protein Pcinc_041180 [Petrolisthes cinctipes]KAK3891985.1 hypothetical protein Pcinc_004151 [Petrolisthes cinctipes]